MLKISQAAADGLAEDSARRYCVRLAAWLETQDDVARSGRRPTPQWCYAQLQIARRHAITQESDVADFTHLALVKGEAWFNGADAREILESARSGELKTFQLKLLAEGAF